MLELYKSMQRLHWKTTSMPARHK